MRLYQSAVLCPAASFCLQPTLKTCRLYLVSLCSAGEQLLQEGEVFSLRPLQLYSVSQQLRQATPTCLTGDAKTDLGHILDFTCRLRYLKVTHL